MQHLVLNCLGPKPDSHPLGFTSLVLLVRLSLSRSFSVWGAVRSVAEGCSHYVCSHHPPWMKHFCSMLLFTAGVAGVTSHGRSALTPCEKLSRESYVRTRTTKPRGEARGGRGREGHLQGRGVSRVEVPMGQRRNPMDSKAASHGVA